MKWKNSKKQTFSQNEVLSILNKVAENKKHKIIVGSDSVKIGGDFVFANAICVINENSLMGADFCKRFLC